MGKSITLVLVALLLTGCAANRIVDKRYSLNQEKSEILRHNDYSVDYKSIVDSLCRTKTFVFDIYDTDKDADSCGNYPLKMHGEITENTQRAVISTETRQDSTITCDSVYFHEQTETTQHAQIKRKSPINMICFMVIVVSIVFAYRTYNKNR